MFSLLIQRGVARGCSTVLRQQMSNTIEKEIVQGLEKKIVEKVKVGATDKVSFLYSSNKPKHVLTSGESAYCDSIEYGSSDVLSDLNLFEKKI